MKPIPEYKPQSMFRRDVPPIFWQLIGLTILVGLLFLLGRAAYRHSDVARPMPVNVVEQQKPIPHFESYDGKVVCYVAEVGISCLPIWMIEKPRSWLVMYPVPKTKKP